MPISLLQNLGYLVCSPSSTNQLLPAVSCMLHRAALPTSRAFQAPYSTAATALPCVQAVPTPPHSLLPPPAAPFHLNSFASSAASRVRTMGTGNGPQGSPHIRVIGFPPIEPMIEKQRQEQLKQLQASDKRLTSDFTALMGSYAALMKQLEKGAQQVQVEARNEGVDVMDTAQELIEVKAQQEAWAEVSAVARKVLHIAKTWQVQQQVFEFRHALATAQHNLGEHGQALELWLTQEAEQAERNKQVEGGTEEYARTLRGQAATLLVQGQASDAVQRMDVAESFYRRKHGKGTLQLMYPYDIIGCALWVLAHPDDDGVPNLKQLERAGKFLYNAWQIRREHQGTDHPEYLTTLRNYSELQMEMALQDPSHYDRCEINWREQINVWAKKGGKSSMMTVTSVLGWADCLRDKGEAVKAYDMAIEGLEGAQGDLKKHEFTEQTWQACMDRAKDCKAMAEEGVPHRGGPWFPPAVGNLTLRPESRIWY